MGDMIDALGTFQDVVTDVTGLMSISLVSGLIKIMVGMGVVMLVVTTIRALVMDRPERVRRGRLYWQERRRALAEQERGIP